MTSETGEFGDSDGAVGKAADESAERPTLKTIAQIAGLAVPTISRALSDAPDIGEATKKRVREIATRIGYRPNRAGVRLRTGKTNVISLVLSTEHEMMNHTARLISTLAGDLRGTPYHLIVTPFFPDEDPMLPIRYIVETGSADGIIINQIEPRDRRVAYMMEKGFPFATHGRTEWSHPYADFDNEAWGAISVRRLVARGRRKLALLRPPHGQSYSIHMHDGAAREALRLGVDLSVIREASADGPSAAVEPAIAAALTGPDACDGLIIPSAMAAMAAVTAAERAGLVLGRDFDLSSKEAISFLSRFRNEILVTHEDVTTAGTFLAKALIHRIAHPEAEPMTYLDVPVMPADPALASVAPTG